MNYYLSKALRIYLRIELPNVRFETSNSIVRAILALEMANRNIIWRIVEYVCYMLLPETAATKRLLTIGRFQLRNEYLSGSSKITRIHQANDPVYVDRLLSHHLQIANWSDLSASNIQSIALFYNGHNNGLYAESIDFLLRMKHAKKNDKKSYV